MTKVLANDGIAEEGKRILEDAGYEVVTDKIEQDKLAEGLKDFSGIIVRSATKVTEDIIDANPHLKVIGRAGVGVDNIAVKHAESKGIKVVNTPAAASLSVAELAFAHMAGGVRFLQQSNREMAKEGKDKFKDLKKAYSKGIELRGKTLGLIGIGRIGQETAKIALGAGMNVVISDPMYDEITLEMDHLQVDPKPSFKVKTISNDELFKQADFISLHVPAMDKPLINKDAFGKMKDGVGIINCARGGVIDEEALLEALDSGKVGFAGLDVFENEPTPNEKLLNHPKISVTPHIGASSVEAQKRVGVEIAEKVAEGLK